MKYLIERLEIGEEKTGTVKKEGPNYGKPYTYHRIGVKIQGKWYNATLFGKEIEKVRGIEGKEIDLVLYDEPSKDDPAKVYAKFKFPSQDEVLKQKINDLERRVAKLEKSVFDLDGPESQPDLPAEEPNDLPF